MDFQDHQQLHVTVVGVAPVGSRVEVEGLPGVFGFIDRVKPGRVSPS
ncbi:hypothetical protein [Streptomyces sp. NPDC101132]